MNLEILNFFNFNALDIKIKIGIIVILVSLLILFIILILWFISSILKKRKKSGIKKIKKIKKSPKEDLYSFDKNIKNYLKNYLKLESNPGYAELAEKLKEKNKPELVNLCQKMNYALYSGKEIKEEDVKNLKIDFKNTIGSKPEKKKQKEKHINIKKKGKRKKKK